MNDVVTVELFHNISTNAPTEGYRGADPIARVFTCRLDHRPDTAPYEAARRIQIIAAGRDIAPQDQALARAYAALRHRAVRRGDLVRIGERWLARDANGWKHLTTAPELAVRDRREVDAYVAPCNLRAGDVITSIEGWPVAAPGLIAAIRPAIRRPGQPREWLVRCADPTTPTGHLSDHHRIMVDPAAAAQLEATAALLELAHRAEIDPIELDDEVIDAQCSAASEINNGGLGAQIPFLVLHLGADHVAQVLESLGRHCDPNTGDLSSLQVNQ